MRFVVQRHSAPALHYDFRLEIDGVLKSWAVTKEPADDPSVKRLAVRTADIPDDEHGPGPVELWDRGEWIPEEAPLPAFRRGRLEFGLRGKRMKGRWALVRMGNASTRTKDLWLLMKLQEGEGLR